MVEPASRLRPLTLGEMLSEGVRLYREHFFLLWSVALLGSIPTFVSDLAGGDYAAVAVLRTYAQQIMPSINLGPGAIADPQVVAAFAIGGVLSLVLLPFSIGAIVRASTSVALGAPTNLVGVLRATLSRYWGIWGVSTLLALTALAMIALVTIPVVIFALVSWALCLEVLFVEGTGVMDSLRRSRTLVRGTWWRVFGILLATSLVLSAVSYAPTLLADPVSSLLPGEMRPSFAALVASLASSLVMPVQALVAALLYIDLRVRKEGLLEQLAAEHESGRADRPLS